MVTSRHRRIAAWALVLGGIAVFAVAFWPTPIDAGFADALRGWLTELQTSGGPELLRYGVVEFAANIALFVPVGFVLAVLLPPRRRWLSPLLCFLLSLGIEFGQVVLASSRLGDVTDLIGNTLGGLIGTVLLTLLLAISRRRAARRARTAPAVSALGAR
ncbi:VanZ family protein [Mycetocola zhadangensis]|uniref:VanZ family protein n=1 Tax=Mycetocola zhadangensis TaxID=1164595 RepID=A0A3L7IWX9_9MICO|nr:VanZ family protein [Mycetocola zhadangensis]RLQ82625.1 VanZ family protein [Mycetocola zhadangensis]GGE99734.1 hypothetical protein GCM10011313_23300 [Mycetocola zhadangensis]